MNDIPLPDELRTVVDRLCDEINDLGYGSVVVKIPVGDSVNTVSIFGFPALVDTMGAAKAVERFLVTGHPEFVPEAGVFLVDFRRRHVLVTSYKDEVKSAVFAVLQSFGWTWSTKGPKVRKVPPRWGRHKKRGRHG
jgi:hypothetical protein